MFDVSTCPGSIFICVFYVSSGYVVFQVYFVLWSSQLTEISSVLNDVFSAPLIDCACLCDRIYVHSAAADWRRCLHTLRLPDAVVDIV